jgi:membrane-associated phospholipid phosphatase
MATAIREGMSRSWDRRALRIITWRSLILFAIAGLATFGFVRLAELVIEGRADAPDRAMALAIRRLDTPVLDHIFIALTRVGGQVMLAVIVIGVALWLWRDGHRRTAIIVVLNAAVCQLLMVSLKLYIQRPRPTLFDVIARPDTFSFPSGHAMSAMATFGAIAAAVVAHHPRLRSLVIACAALLIFAIGFSRVYLGVHWPLDVIAGFAAGVPLLVATVHLIHTRQRASMTKPDLRDLTGSDAMRSRRTSPQ